MALAEAEQCNRILNSVEARVGGVVVNRSGLPGSGIAMRSTIIKQCISYFARK